MHAISDPVASVPSAIVLSLQEPYQLAGHLSPAITLDTRGGTIGRAQQCDWVLEAEGVSRTHACIRYINGTFYLEDRSTNGILRNAHPVRVGYPQPLSDGDQLVIDQFHIAVKIVGAVTPTASSGAVHAVVSDGDVGLVTPDPRSVVMQSDAYHLVTSAARVQKSVDPLDIIGHTQLPDVSSLPHKQETSLYSAPVASTFYKPPHIAQKTLSQGALPEHWDRTQATMSFVTSASQDHAPVNVQAPTPPKVAAHDARVPENSLSHPHTPASPASADMDIVHPPASGVLSSQEDDIAQLRSLVTALVGQVMVQLRARAHCKNLLRLPITLVQSTQNNPLKFAATAEEAVRRLLGASDPSYMSANQAIMDAQEDLVAHHSALFAGMRAGYAHMMRRFSPEQFYPPERSYLPFQSSAQQAWKKYVATYTQIMAEPDHGFETLFSSVLAATYAEESQSTTPENSDALPTQGHS